ncbi:MAG: hypothetical protein P8Z81_14220 [Deinococcales bacterium]
MLDLVDADNHDALRRTGLGRSGFFGARVREAAGRALLVTRAGPQQRLPLWVTRLRAQKLLSAVWSLPDFPILLEAWRTCLQDEFDLDALRQRLRELADGRIAVSYASTVEASPFAASLVWGQTNSYMYMDDTPGAFAGRPSGLRGELLAEVARSPELRPLLPRELVAAFERKRQRLEPGYQPASVRELFDWVKERVLVPEPEWLELAAQLPFEPLEAFEGPLAWLEPPGAEHRAVIALEDEDRLRAALGLGEAAEPGALERLLAQWLQAYGPLDVDYLRAVWGISPTELDGTLDALVETGTVERGSLSEGGGDEVCDLENLQTLLAMLRRRAVPTLQPRPLVTLQPFLAERQAVGRAASLGDALEPLLAYPGAAELWESEILPARLPNYDPRALDELMEDTGLAWLGAGERSVCFALPDEVPLLTAAEAAFGAPAAWRGLGTGRRPGQPEPLPSADAAQGADAGPAGREAAATPADADVLRAKLAPLFPDPLGRYGFEALAGRAGLGTADLARLLWSGVWTGVVANDAASTLRQGIANRFRPADAVAGRSRGGPAAAGRARPGRGAFARWRTSRPFTGSWRLLDPPPTEEDALTGLERDKDRVRLVLERYGVVFRELLERELPAFRWGRLFRALRVMELSGEVTGGHFFEGVPGLQFADARALSELQAGVEARVYWLDAADPAAVTGLGLEGLRAQMPARVPSTHLAFRGADLLVVSKRNAGELNIEVAPDDPDLPALLGFIPHLLERAERPRRHLSVRRVNAVPAATSPYRAAIERLADVTAEGDTLSLFKRY